jgi:thiamine biosynthesis lipoprotein
MKKYFSLLFLVCLFSCKNEKNTLNIIEGNAIGTTYSVRYLSNSDINFESKIDSLITILNKSVSTYSKTSDISKINSGDTTVVVDAIFEEVFTKSNKIYTETHGDFDPTIGILVNAWGFGPGETIKNLDSVKIDSLLKFVGFDKVSIEKGKVTKKFPEIYFDFNAIAKGYLVDMIGRLFEFYKIENYMVEIGGEIRARGINQKGTPWRIAIENPNFDDTRSFATTILLDNESIATSGNYRKFRTSENGKKYVHTINTKTGFATESNLLSASVISKSDCADVDGYATAFMAMGLEKTLQFLETHPDLKVFLIYIDENGDMKTHTSVLVDF